MVRAVPKFDFRLVINKLLRRIVIENHVLTGPLVYICARPSSLVFRDATHAVMVNCSLLPKRQYFPSECYLYIGIQPLGRSGQRPEFSQATGMTLLRCVLGKFLGVACHCFSPLFRRSHFSPSGASTSATK